jgi:hypothetical protein
MSEEHRKMLTLQEEFSQAEIGQSSQFRNLTLFPLLRRSAPSRQLDYLLLEDGIAQGKVEVSEIHAGGSVSELRLENNAELPVLLVDGEELIGAKQNRVLNLTILAPAKQTTVIPVSCVEAGRWRMSAADLKTSDQMMYSFGRGEQLAHVTESMRSNGTRKSNQAAIWRNIAAKAMRLKAASPTGAMADIYERYAGAVEEFARAFAWQEGQCGVAFAITGRILGLEIFDHPEVMRRFFQKLVRSYALDALDAPAANETASVEAVCAMVTQIGAAQSFSKQALGLGKDVRFNGSNISGAALWAYERYVHICTFAKNVQNSDAPNFWTRITRPSHRRTF